MKSNQLLFPKNSGKFFLNFVQIFRFQTYALEYGISQPYTLVTRILEGKTVLDCETNTFGIRSIRYDAAKGFS